MLPANFDGFPFHVLQNARESGRRIALHEFPKKEITLRRRHGAHGGRLHRAGLHHRLSARAPGQGNGTLYQRDYRIARDLLQERLDRGGPGVLQLPTFVRSPMIVVCTRYRLSEEEKAGGYCVFDMQFVERGKSRSWRTSTRRTICMQSQWHCGSKCIGVGGTDREVATASHGIVQSSHSDRETDISWVRTIRSCALSGRRRKMGPIRPRSDWSKIRVHDQEYGQGIATMEMWQTGRAVNVQVRRYRSQTDCRRDARRVAGCGPPRAGALARTCAALSATPRRYAIPCCNPI